MFTVCPKCSLTLVVTAADLRVAQGYVRCGRCSNVFNALSRLSEDRQAGAGAQPSAGAPAGNSSPVQPQPASEPPPAPAPKSAAAPKSATPAAPEPMRYGDDT